VHFLISSGNGVNEVCRALYLFLNWLEKRYSFDIAKIEQANCKNCYNSVLIESEDMGLLKLLGTHLWQAQSPFRPKHKRKNWYFSLSLADESQDIKIDESKIIYQTMRSPKKGGQHVNKTSSGVRAIYKPLSIEAVSFDERSQHLNKSLALKRLKEKIYKLQSTKAKESIQNRWQNAKSIQRGNEIKIFKGAKFIEKK